MKQLTDDSPMPIGKKFFGTSMIEVPAWHLNWWWVEKGLKNKIKSNQVADYIGRNLNGLKAENPNMIWD